MIKNKSKDSMRKNREIISTRFKEEGKRGGKKRHELMAGKDQHNKLQIIIITNEEVRMGRGWLHVKRNIQRKKKRFSKIYK